VQTPNSSGVFLYQGRDIVCVAVIVEATYGVNRHEERTQREKRLVETVRGIVSRGGRVLMPVVALGRAQVLCWIQLTVQKMLSTLAVRGSLAMW
jgi:Cft2 family RNA processing exonuclease